MRLAAYFLDNDLDNACPVHYIGWHLPKAFADVFVDEQQEGMQLLFPVSDNSRFAAGNNAPVIAAAEARSLRRRV